MKRKLAEGLLLSVLLAGILTATLNISRIAAASQTTLSIYPSTIAKSPSDLGSTFTVSVTIGSVKDFVGFDINITWSNTLITFSSLDNSSLKTIWSNAEAFFDPLPSPGYVNGNQNSTGYVDFAVVKLGGSSFNGTGTLYSITFKIVKASNSTLSTPIHFSMAKLSNSTAGKIPATLIDGRYTMSTMMPDVAVTSVVTSKAGCLPMPVVGRGYPLTANVTVQNQGNVAETFNVSLYANTTMVAISTITNLSPGAYFSLVLKWDTTGFAYGNYNITGKASTVPNETNTANNICAGGSIEVSIPGDVDGNQWVNVLDVVKITSIYGLKQGNPKFSPNCDIDGDGKITILDVVACTSHYYQKWS